MLYWAIVFLVIAIVAAYFGFTVAYSVAAAIAKFLFILFLIVAIVAVVMHFMHRRHTP
jgi:uncharacterized membrane protein YtjA (UPF0391 family)